MPGDQGVAMDTEFQIASCHCNHAGRAYITIKHLPSGALLGIQHLPFEHEHDQTLQQEQQRIATEALRLAREAAAFLAASIESCSGWPTAEHTHGAAPQENQPPNAFGFPTPPA
jgi:hypothetical protein